MPRLILGWHTMDIQDMDGVVGQHGELGVDIMGKVVESWVFLIRDPSYTALV